MSKSLNVESLNFDFNNLGPNFLQILVEKLVANKRSDNIKSGSTNIGDSPGARSGNSSLMTDESASISGTH